MVWARRRRPGVTFPRNRDTESAAARSSPRPSGWFDPRRQVVTVQHRHELTSHHGPRLTGTADLALPGFGVVLTPGSSVWRLADAMSAAIAIPVMTVGIALVAIEQLDSRRA